MQYVSTENMVSEQDNLTVQIRKKNLKEIAILCLKSHDSQLGYSFPSLQSAVVRQQPKNK